MAYNVFICYTKFCFLYHQVGYIDDTTFRIISYKL